MSADSETIGMAIGSSPSSSFEEKADLVSYRKVRLLTAAEHLASRRKYENPEIAKTILWFLSAIIIQFLAIAIFVFALMLFFNN